MKCGWSIIHGKDIVHKGADVSAQYPNHKFPATIEVDSIDYILYIISILEPSCYFCSFAWDYNQCTCYLKEGRCRW